MKIRTAVISSILALLVVGVAAIIFLRDREVVELSQSESFAVFESVQVVSEEGTSFEFEIVASPEARAQGLSGRSELPSNYGMLFVFDAPDFYGFWMKDMLVSIDIVWLADDGTIIGIERNVSPSTYPTPFYSPVPVRLVLETRPGEAIAQEWEVGTRIELPL